MSIDLEKMCNEWLSQYYGPEPLSIRPFANRVAAAALRWAADAAKDYTLGEDAGNRIADEADAIEKAES